MIDIRKIILLIILILVAICQGIVCYYQVLEINIQSDVDLYNLSITNK